MPAGADPAVFSGAQGSHALWLNGQTDEAIAWSIDAIRRAEKLGHPYALTIAHAYALILAQFRDDIPALREHASAVVELCARYDFAYYEDWPTILCSWADRDTDEGAAARIERAIGKLTTLRAMLQLQQMIERIHAPITAGICAASLTTCPTSRSSGSRRYG